MHHIAATAATDYTSLTIIRRSAPFQAQSHEHHFHPSSCHLPAAIQCPQSNRFIPAASKKNQQQQITRKAPRSPRPRRVITVSCPSGGYYCPGRWTSEFIVSLKDLQLGDLAQDDGCTDTQACISLCLDKHAGFGMSVDGRVVTSIVRTCSCCSSSYSNQIDAKFNVWVLPSSNRKKDDQDPSTRLPELGGDPSVIYVRPGQEADLDSLVQETIRLQISTMETCSESCEEAQPQTYHIGVQNTASLDTRWSKLLELRKQLS